jgi:hypothetical protein
VEEEEDTEMNALSLLSGDIALYKSFHFLDVVCMLFKIELN